MNKVLSVIDKKDNSCHLHFCLSIWDQDFGVTQIFYFSS